ncbi:MAG: amidase [Proteobacteria bacterium]|nr:amidase [Pseudomonadota bacterium]
MGLGAFAAAAASAAAGNSPETPPAGAPPAFGMAAGMGPEVSVATFAEAEKLVQVTLTPAQRAQAAASWRGNLSAVYERRSGPRRVDLPAQVAPYSSWDPRTADRGRPPAARRFVRSPADPGRLPAREAEIAFAPLTKLSRWIEMRAITSERLTQIYLDRLARYDQTLRCVITATPERALAQARAADREIGAGRYRGPLHGIPWGAKDLLDTAGIRTTYGAEPFRDRIPAADAAVVRRLDAAGAVLVAKLSLGALALNDIWFGGQTMNPWLPQEGASGSSAGPGAATAAGLVGFAIGSETGGSIVAPSMRCGVTGLRPTYGRVARTGAMTLCWSLDKLGPMTRGVEDAMLVLDAIQGADAGDLQSVDVPLEFDAGADIRGLRLGYFPAWMREAPATDVDRGALEALRALGLAPVEVALPDWPYASLDTILFAEGAAAFEQLTLSGAMDQLREQTYDAWPNLFRQARFLSAVDFVQADRLRRRVAEEMARLFSQVDLLLVPSLRDEILTITNATGHPSLTLKTGFVDVAEARSDWAPDPSRPLPKFSPARRVPHGVTLIGRLYDEGTIARVGIALERASGVANRHPAGFGA